MVEALTKLGEAARRAREYISPWSYLSPSDVASNLPGGGIPAAVEPYKQGLRKTAEATQAFREGRWGDAARWYGSGMLDTATAGLSALPEGGAMAKLAMAAAPAIKAAVGASEAGADGAGAMQKLSGIRAFHGSPHDFDRFDMSKIGTGEGAQAYGHGLYFAESEGVARSYRDALAGDGTELHLNGVPYDKLPEPMQQAVLSFDTGRPAEKHIALLEKRMQADPDTFGPELEAYRQLVAGAADGSMKVERRPLGSMYEVRINADPEHFLDWDKPLSEQPASVRNAIDKIYGVEPDEAAQLADPMFQKTGQGIYQMLLDSYGRAGGTYNKGNEGATSAFREAGIPGIKYLDAGSRGAGDGTRNYVVFDDNLVEIIRKYGWMPGMAIPAAMALEMQQAQEQSAPQM